MGRHAGDHAAVEHWIVSQLPGAVPPCPEEWLVNPSRASKLLYFGDRPFERIVIDFVSDRVALLVKGLLWRESPVGAWKQLPSGAG